MKWRRLNDLPKALYKDQPLSTQGICVWDDRAWLFTGSKKVWVFDLHKEIWTTVITDLRDTKWPYAKDYLSDHCVTTFDGKLYVFGGEDLNAIIGTNLFMVLDLRTLKWTYLGGTSDMVPNGRYPGPRRLASMWVVPEQKRLYLLYGSASRQAAMISGKQYGSQNDYTYDDMWSYDLADPSAGQWTRERFRCNFPSPRTEMASIYNPTLGRTIVYGGYAAFLPASTEDGNHYAFAFFGETYAMNPATKIWQQAVVRGFPSYRAQSQFFVDDTTGKTYLFGGWSHYTFWSSRLMKRV